MDWIEVINTSTTDTADISGWFLRDNDITHTPLTIPASTVLAPGAVYSMDVDIPTIVSVSAGPTDRYFVFAKL